MPSKQLYLLSQQIENQDTDHFGKLYMYASLLNAAAGQKQTFEEGLPRYPKLLPNQFKKNVHYGVIPENFQDEVKAYATHFITAKRLYWSDALYNVVMAYFRKGTISDLTFIIEKMLHHMKARERAASPNQEIYQNEDFIEHKAKMVDFLEQVSEMNQTLLSMIDNGGNAVMVAPVIVAGLIIILASVFSLIPSIIGAALIVGGVATACYFALQAKQKVESFNVLKKEVAQKTADLSKDQSLVHNPHGLFFSSLLIPATYSSITLGEQVAVKAGDRIELNVARDTLDVHASTLASI